MELGARVSIGVCVAAERKTGKLDFDVGRPDALETRIEGIRALVSRYRAVVSRRAAMACATKIQWFTILKTYARNPLLTPDCHEGF